MQRILLSAFLCIRGANKSINEKLLSIQYGLAKTKLARSVLDAAWGMFVSKGAGITATCHSIRLNPNSVLSPAIYVLPAASR
jgi:hypothetical protein